MPNAFVRCVLIGCSLEAESGPAVPSTPLPSLATLLLLLPPLHAAWRNLAQLATNCPPARPGHVR